MVGILSKTSQQEKLKIFIAYTNDDEDLALALKEKLSDYDVFLFKDLRANNEWPIKLFNEVIAADIMYVLFSEAGSKSPGINQEIGATLMIRHIFDNRIFPKLLQIIREGPMLRNRPILQRLINRLIELYEDFKGRSLARARKPKIIVLKDKGVKKVGYLTPKTWLEVEFPQTKDTSNEIERKKNKILDCAISELL